MMTYKEIEKAVQDVDRYLGYDFYNYINDCIVGEEDESEIFDAPVIFECSENARKAHEPQLRGRVGLYLFVMNCDYLFGEEQIEKYKKLKGAKLNFEKPRELSKGSVFYIGSHNSSIYARIGQHINRTSRSLSLASKYRHFMCERLMVVGLPIKKNVAELLKSTELLKSFLILTENSIHKYWNPYVGTAR